MSIAMALVTVMAEQLRSANSDRCTLCKMSTIVGLLTVVAIVRSVT